MSRSELSRGGGGRTGPLGVYASVFSRVGANCSHSGQGCPTTGIQQEKTRTAAAVGFSSEIPLRDKRVTRRLAAHALGNPKRAPGPGDESNPPQTTWEPRPSNRSPELTG